MLKKLNILFFAALLFAARAEAQSQQMEFVLGTLCSVNLFESGSSSLYARIFSRIREIDHAMSVSGLARINEKAGIEAVPASEDVIDVLERAVYYAALSDGAFDPTIGPLVQLWGIGSENPRIPSSVEIAAALKLVNWRDLEIDRRRGTVFLKKPGMSLDLGAIAKGYAADEAARIAREANTQRALFDLGGNIFALGARNGSSSRKSATPWRIGVQDPLEDRGAYIGILQVQNTSVVTSGVYERFFESGGRRYHHILSTADGWPVSNGLLSVTIVTGRSMDADALSTSVFALGYKKGRELVESLPAVEAVFIFRDRSVRITNGLRGIFTLTSKKYFLSDAD